MPPFSKRCTDHLNNNVGTYCCLMLTALAAIIVLLSVHYDHISSKHKKQLGLGIYGTVISFVLAICVLLIWCCRLVPVDPAAPITVSVEATAPQPIPNPVPAQPVLVSVAAPAPRPIPNPVPAASIPVSVAAPAPQRTPNPVPAEPILVSVAAPASQPIPNPVAPDPVPVAAPAPEPRVHGGVEFVGGVPGNIDEPEC